MQLHPLSQLFGAGGGIIGAARAVRRQRRQQGDARPPSRHHRRRRDSSRARRKRTPEPPRHLRRPEPFPFSFRSRNNPVGKLPLAANPLEQPPKHRLIVRVEQKSRVADQFRMRIDLRGDHRRPRRHRLDHRQRKSLRPRRADEHERLAIKPRQFRIRNMPRKAQPVGILPPASRNAPASAAISAAG